MTEHHHEHHPDHHHKQEHHHFEISVNTRERKVHATEISFEKVLELANIDTTGQDTPESLAHSKQIALSYQMTT